jgi:hypothetical protein
MEVRQVKIMAVGMVTCTRTCTALLAIASVGAIAQDNDVDLVRTARDAVLHTAPKADAPAAFAAPSGTELIWVARSKRNGYFRVIRKEQGPQAWLAEADAQVARAADDFPEAKMCAASLQQCPARGCEAEGTPEAESNEMKRRQPKVGVPVTLSFDDFAQLQRQADERVGQGPLDPTPAQRARLHDLHVAHGQVSEGDLVRVVGYIAKGDEGLHVNKAGESVNCQLKKPADNDFHIPLVEAPANQEFKGIVVEMIPQDRPPEWSIDALKDIQAKGLKVWAEGGLSYDKVHYVNDDSANPLKDDPDRMSLWEIHPVTKFLVCRKDHCDAQAEDDWTPLGKK